jgi:hypothetical protein
MGLKTSGGGTIYLSIQNGKIARRVQEPTATSKSRVIEGSGKLIHEELYDSVEGMLTGLATREGNYGKELMITINDQVESYQLQIKLSSSPASAFLRALPNVAPEMPLLIIPKIQEKDGVRRTSIILSQGNKGVKWAFTKDNPGDLPPMKKIKVKGKETWDDSEQLEFFEKLIIEYSNTLKATGTLAIGAEPLDDDGIPF